MLDDVLFRRAMFAADEGGDSGDDGDTADQPKGDDGEKVTITKAEWDAAQRERAEARRDAKKARTEAEAAKREKEGKDGDHAKRAEDAEARATKAEEKATELERQQRVGRIAGRLKFRDPVDAFRFLDGDDLDDDASAERALKQLARDKKYLVGTGGRSGGEIDDGDTGNATGSKAMDQMIRRQAGY